MLGVFGGKETQETLRRVRVFLHYSSKQRIPIEALEIESIRNQPIPNPNEEMLRELRSRGIDTKSISNERNAEDSISLLIGSDFYWEIGTGKVLTVRHRMRALETRLGWTLQGPTQAPAEVVHCSNIVVLKQIYRKLQPL